MESKGCHSLRGRNVPRRGRAAPAVVLGAALAAALALPAAAQGLRQWQDAAVASDPALAGAEAQQRAGAERAEQAAAALRPSVSLGASASRTDYHDLTGLSQPPDRDFSTRQYALSLNQPLYRPVPWQALQQSRVAVDALEAQRDAVHADLLQRLVGAFFELQAVRSDLVQLRGQRQATAEQLALARRSFDAGTVSIVDVRDAEAKFDAVTAQEAAAEMERQAKEAGLEQVVGQRVHVPGAGLPPAEAPDLGEADLARWLDLAESGSPVVGQARLALAVAQLEVRKMQAGSLPTLDFSLSQQSVRAGATTVSALPQSGRFVQAGLNLNVPLYAGGGLDARVREAVAQEDKATADLEAARRQVGGAVRQAFYAALGAIAQFRGLQAAERSAETALAANRRGYEVGVRIGADVLAAQSQLYQTRRDKARAGYEAWAQFFRLKTATGTAGEEDLARIDGLFAPAASGVALAAAAPAPAYPGLIRRLRLTQSAP
ncbi:TolC family outer membrane protein [uncultured Xylophilus sp.]|uniref:TolC family outer membrane protein n=1 Tax=uncultured Xylophilus sp. TaxID=296832 RepID=UPI0025E4AF97|nr:TolC family outer membrane protein [uncultured Xylophilus sp.]